MATAKTILATVGMAALGIGAFEAAQALPGLWHHATVSDSQPRHVVQTVKWSPGRVFPLRRLRPGSFPANTDPSSHSASTIDANSLNWAGLVQEGTNERSVTASWKAPGFANSASNPNSAIAEWIGLGGMQSNALIQVGTITTPNSNGTATTTAFWEKLPSSAVQLGTIPTGATVDATIEPVGADSWRLMLTVAGSATPMINKVVTLTASQAQAVESSADWITEAPTTNQGVAPLAPVSQTVMTDVSANNVPLSQMNPSSLTTIGLFSQSGQLMAAPVSDPRSNSIVVNTIYGSLPSNAMPDGDGLGSGWGQLPGFNTFPFGGPGSGFGRPGNGFGGFGGQWGNGWGGGLGGFGVGSGSIFPGVHTEYGQQGGISWSVSWSW
ncbi:MAG: G1 family endopeptidase [Firmicutes bacterium]|nr:G1 family endopeptidase [Bacillota bacterium]